MGSTATTPVIKYPLDLTGASPTNRVVGEVHDLSINPNRAFVPDYGPFYTKGLVIADQATGKILDRETDYLCLQLEPDATAASGEEVCSIVLIVNPDVSNTVLFTGQMVGGEYSNYATAIQQMLNDLNLDNRPVIWAEIIGTPNYFPPAPHFHSISDTYGWEVLADAVENLRQAILTGDQFAFKALSDSLFSRLQLYQPKLGYTPVQQGVSLGDGDPGTIVLKADGQGNILGFLNGTELGQVLFSSSQINDTLTDLQQRVGALENGQTNLTSRMSTVEQKANVALPAQIAQLNATVLANQQAINLLNQRVTDLENAVTFGALNITPADGDVNVALSPTLIGDNYYPKFGIPQKNRRFQLVAATGSFDTPLLNTAVSTTSGAVLQYAVGTPLDANQNYMWRYQDTTIKNQSGVWSVATFFSTSSTYVVAPTVTAPADTVTGVGARPVITLSAFATSGAADTQRATSVEITDALTGAVVWLLDQSTTQLDNITVPGNTLKPNTQYKIRARQYGNTLGASAWSAYNTFTTQATFIDTPTVTAPVNNSTVSTDQPTITISPFAVTSGSDTLLSTSARILDDTGAVVWQLDQSSSQLNNIVVPYGVLHGGQTYTVQAKYYGKSYGPSDWSPAITFTVATQASTSVVTSQATVETSSLTRSTATSWTTTYATATLVNTTINTSQSTLATTSFTTYYNTNSAHNTSVAMSKNTTTAWTSSYLTSRSTVRSTWRSSTVISSFAKSRSTTTSFSTAVTECVAAGTMITMPDGSLKVVDELVQGEVLRSVKLPGLQPETVEEYADYHADSLAGAEISTTHIQNIMKATAQCLYLVWAEGRDHPLQVTQDHPFLIEDVDGSIRFCTVSMLTTDDRLFNGALAPLAIEKIEKIKGDFVIFKIDCEPLDLFIHDDLVGHNMKFDPDTGTSSPPHTTYVLTSRATTTSWTSYVTHHPSVVYNTTFNTSFATLASLSRATATSWTSIRSTISSAQTSRVTSQSTAILTAYSVNTNQSVSTNTSNVTSAATNTSWTSSHSTNTSFNTTRITDL